MPQRQERKSSGFVDSFLQPLFDALGLNGAEALRNSQKPREPKPQPKPGYKRMSDSELRERGYSKENIRAVREWEKANGY